MDPKDLASETCMFDAISIDERLGKIVSILERYLETRRGAARNLPFVTSSPSEAAKANSARFPKEENTYPPLLADNSVRLWHDEALSHFQKSSWEGELKYHSYYRV